MQIAFPSAHLLVLDCAFRQREHSNACLLFCLTTEAMGNHLATGDLLELSCASSVAARFLSTMQVFLSLTALLVKKDSIVLCDADMTSALR